MAYFKWLILFLCLASVCFGETIIMKAGTTDPTIDVYLHDASLAAVTGLAGADPVTDIDYYYSVKGAAEVAVTTVGQCTATGAWEADHACEMGHGNYRIHLRAAVVAGAAGTCVKVVVVGTGAVPKPVDILLTPAVDMWLTLGNTPMAQPTNWPITLDTGGKVSLADNSITEDAVAASGAAKMMSGIPVYGTEDPAALDVSTKAILYLTTGDTYNDTFAQTGAVLMAETSYGYSMGVVEFYDSTNDICYMVPPGFQQTPTNAGTVYFCGSVGGQLTKSIALHSGAIQTYTDLTTVTLAATASATDDFYKGCTIEFVGDTGSLTPTTQTTTISAYNGTTKVATLSPALTEAVRATVSYATMYRILGSPAKVIHLDPAVTAEMANATLATALTQPTTASVPGDTPTLDQAIAWLYSRWFNKSSTTTTGTSTEFQLFDRAGTGKLYEQTVEDDGSKLDIEAARTAD